MIYDQDVIEGLKDNCLEYNVLKVLHNDGDYVYSDEGLYDMCICNEYEFLEEGDFKR